jgi:hypothetical protein
MMFSGSMMNMITVLQMHNYNLNYTGSGTLEMEGSAHFGL